MERKFKAGTVQLHLVGPQTQHNNRSMKRHFTYGAKCQNMCKGLLWYDYGMMAVFLYLLMVVLYSIWREHGQERAGILPIWFDHDIDTG